MKKLILFLIIIGSFSCSKSDKGDDYYTIEKATVKGVKIAFMSSGSRASNMDQYSAGFKTMDENGNYKPIRFITNRKDTVDMDISYIMDGGDKYMVLDGYFKMNGTAYLNMIVNCETEATYLLPRSKYDSYDRIVFHDKNNNLYMRHQYMVYKINTSDQNNMASEPYLAQGQQANYFTVNADGVCHYVERVIADSKFKCPGGRVYNIKELVDDVNNISQVIQGMNGNYYIVWCAGWSGNLDVKFYRLDSKTDNELTVTLAGETSGVPCYISTNCDFIQNKERGTLMYASDDHIIEYNENTGKITVHDIPAFEFVLQSKDKLSGYLPSNTTIVTKSNVYTLSGTTLQKIDLKTLQLTSKDMVQEGYEIKTENISGAENSDELTFAGLRYKDGMNVVGTIDSDFNVHVFTNTLSSTPIMNLIRIN